MGRILEGKASLPSLTMAQVTIDTPTTEEVAKLRAKLTAKAIASFDAHTLDDGGPSTFYDLPATADVAYLYVLATRLACDRQGI